MEVKLTALVPRPVGPGLLVPLAVITALVLLYFPNMAQLFQRWVQWDEALAHGLPVVAVFFYLLYQSGPWPLARPGNVTLVLGYSALALCSLAWLVFQAIHITLLTQLILLPLLVLALLPLVGWASLWAQRHLLLLLVFVLPVWDYLNDPLLQLSAAVVGEMVRAVRMTALIEGSSIYIPYGHILIADGCSGLRYFVIALALGYLISYLNGYKEKGLVLVLAIAALLGLLANWVRIFLLIVIGYQSEMQSSLMDDHELFGWVLFAAIVLPAIYFAPVLRRPQPDWHAVQSTWPVARFLGVLAALALGPVIALLVDLKPKPPGEWVLHQQNQVLVPVRESVPSTITAPAGATVHTYRVGDAGAAVWVQVHHYARQRESDKLVPYIHRLFDAEHWSLAEARRLSLEGRTLSQQLLRQKGGLRQVVQLQWFDTGGYTSTSVAGAKLLQIPAILFGDNRFSIITLQAECRLGDCAAALERLQHTLQQLQIQQQIQQG